MFIYTDFQISEEQLLPNSVNIYQPRYSLLASALLRLGHTLYLMAGGGSGVVLGRRHELLERAQESFKEGLDVMQTSVHHNPSLSAELHMGNGEQEKNY